MAGGCLWGLLTARYVPRAAHAKARFFGGALPVQGNTVASCGNQVASYIYIGKQAVDRPQPCEMYKLMYTPSMAKSYSVAEARVNLPNILDDVEAGKEVQLTRRGQPVAVLLSRRRYDMLKSDHAHFADVYRAFTDRHSLEEIGLELDFFEPIRAAGNQGSGRRVRL